MAERCWAVCSRALGSNWPSPSTADTSTRSIRPPWTRDFRLIDTRHEQSAGHAADGYARTTGKIGVAMVTAGPGVTDVVSAVTNAYLDCVPTLFIGGAAPLRDAEALPLQGGIDQVALMAPITKWSTRVTHPYRIPDLVAQALRVATTGRPGARLPRDSDRRALPADRRGAVDVCRAVAAGGGTVRPAAGCRADPRLAGRGRAAGHSCRGRRTLLRCGRRARGLCGAHRNARLQQRQGARARAGRPPALRTRFRNALGCRGRCRARGSRADTRRAPGIEHRRARGPTHTRWRADRSGGHRRRGDRTQSRDPPGHRGGLSRDPARPERRRRGSVLAGSELLAASRAPGRGAPGASTRGGAALGQGADPPVPTRRRGGTRRGPGGHPRRRRRGDLRMGRQRGRSPRTGGATCRTAIWVVLERVRGSRSPPRSRIPTGASSA